MDDFNPILQEFRYTLSTLNNTKTSISNATRFCLENVDLWPKMQILLLEELEELQGLDEKINLLFLVDSICQVSMKQNNAAFVEAMEREGYLRRLIMVIFLAGERMRKADDTFSRLEKIIYNWYEKEVFPPLLLDQICSEMARRLPVRPGDTELLKWMDMDRRTRKQRRIDRCFLPDDHQSDDEFVTMWESSPAIPPVPLGSALELPMSITDQLESSPAIPAIPLESALELPKSNDQCHVSDKNMPDEDEPELGEFITNEETRGGTPSLKHGRIERCRIWDLDETLIVFQSMLTYNNADSNKVPHFAEIHLLPPPMAGHNRPKDEEKYLKALIKSGRKLGEAMEDEIFTLLDTKFMDEELREMTKFRLESVDDLVMVDDGADLSGYDFRNDSWKPNDFPNDEWKRKLAYRLRYLRNYYDRARLDPSNLNVPTEKRKEWNRIRDDIDKYSKGWIRAADAVLKRAQEQANGVDVVVTSSQLTPALVKLLLFGLAKYFPAENVYNARASAEGKKTVFGRIMDRFGPNVQYTAIGDGESERQAAESLDIGMRWITKLSQLKMLHGQISNRSI